MAEFSHHHFNRVSAGFITADITFHKPGFTPNSVISFFRFPAFFGLNVKNGDISTSFGQSFGGTQTNAGSTTGDDGGLTDQ